MKNLVNGRSVLIIGHSDADGHLASEQSRRNALRHELRNGIPRRREFTMKRIVKNVTTRVTQQVCRACLACILGAAMGGRQ